MTNAEVLASLLAEIEANDTNYATRYRLVINAMDIALDCGFATGIRIDPNEPGWPVVFIELPTGQVSWHMPQHPVSFDGHSTDEKYLRCKAFAELVAA